MHNEEEILGLDYGEKRIGVSISKLNKKISIKISRLLFLSSILMSHKVRYDTNIDKR